MSQVAGQSPLAGPHTRVFAFGALNSGVDLTAQTGCPSTLPSKLVFMSGTATESLVLTGGDGTDFTIVVPDSRTIEIPGQVSAVSASTSLTTGQLIVVWTSHHLVNA